MSVSAGSLYFARAFLGDEEAVVMAVLAVGGRSPTAPEIAAPEDAGILPVSSSLRIRLLRSSSSSHTVDGAVVDTVLSVPSLRDGGSTLP